MCHSCVRRVFRLSLTDPLYMPPRCCTNDTIPLEYVEDLFDSSFKREWNQKYFDYISKYRIYCPSRRCGELLRPEDLRPEDGRRYGRCTHCRTKVCPSCRGKWHQDHDCSQDDDAARFFEGTGPERKQRCRRCKTVMEVKEGSDHMTW